MAKKFVKITSDLFKQLAMESGVLLKTFDPEADNFDTYLQNENIICGTTGDISATCTPTYSDLGEDVNNCPNGMKELKHLDAWECGMSFTAISITADVLKLALGAAGTTGDKITPDGELKAEHFSSDIWLVVDLTGGGAVCIHLMNALSANGLSISFGKNTKGNLSVELNGHYSIDAQDTVPMEFYLLEAA